MLLAEREYQRADGGTVVVRIFAPEIRGEDACCPVEIDESGRLRRLQAWGVDPMQALLMGLSVIRAHLANLAVRWLDQDTHGIDLAIG